MLDWYNDSIFVVIIIILMVICQILIDQSIMYNKIIVPIDGSKQADKALEHAIDLIKSVSDDDNENIGNTRQFIMLFVIPHFPVPLGFGKPMRSVNTGEIISFSNYILIGSSLCKTHIPTIPDYH